MHSSSARHLPTIVKPSSPKSHHHSISLQVAEKINGGDEMVERTRAPGTPFSSKIGGSLIGNEQNGKKIHGVVKDEGHVDLIPQTKSLVSVSSHNEHLGSDIVESSSSHHVALLKGKHVEDSKKAILSRYPRKEELKGSEKDDIVVTDYQPPHRKAPIHNK
ncbi:hypothetical protein LXL04_012040 [Taraxacum kok-saghyz]